MTMPPISARVKWQDPRKLNGATGVVVRYYPLPFGCENGCREHFWVAWQGTKLEGGFCPARAWDQIMLAP